MRFFMEILCVFWSLKQLCSKRMIYFCTNGNSNIQIRLKFLSAMPFLYPKSPIQKRLRKEPDI